MSDEEEKDASIELPKDNVDMKKPKRVESIIPGDINPIKSRPSEFNRELQSGSKNGSLDKKPKIASGNLATDLSKLDTR